MHKPFLLPDIDECVTGQAGCDENAECINTPGSFYCQCKESYTGSGVEGECHGKESYTGIGVGVDCQGKEIYTENLGWGRLSGWKWV